MRNKILTAIALATTVAAGAFAGYKIATDDELRGRLLRGAQDIVDTSKKKMDVMTEDVAMRTAQVTKNPKTTLATVADVSLADSASVSASPVPS